MSNRTLVIIIVVILVVFGGAVAFMRMRNNSQQADDSQVQSQNVDQQAQVLNQTPPADQQPAPAPDQASSTLAAASSTPAAAGICQRDFDQNKLNTAKVNIANRTVELNVQGFGKIELSFYDKDAPLAVENFLRLANSGYYDCLTFHRVAKGFVIQGGDPNGDGSGGTSAFGKTFADELNSNTVSFKAGYVKGVLAMANSGPNTNGSQFFIMLGDVPLDHSYTIFGKVSAGQDVVDKIGQVDITPVMGTTDGKPVTPVVMSKVQIIK